MKKPVTGNTPKVIEWLAALDHPLKAEIEAVRTIIKHAHPDITEDIKWAAPSFHCRDHMVTFNHRMRDRVHLVFHNAAPVDDGSGFLEGNYIDRRMVYFQDMTDVLAKKSQLEKVILDWINWMDVQSDQ